jgi:hypothetical protein
LASQSRTERLVRSSSRKRWVPYAAWS